MKCVLTIPRDRDPAARELLDDHRVGRQIQRHPAVLLGDRHPEQAELAHLGHDRLRELVHRVVVLGYRQDLLVHELPDHLQDGLLLFGLLGRHGRRGHGTPPSLTKRLLRSYPTCQDPRRWPQTARCGPTSSPPARRLLLAALEAFSEYGYYATTTREIGQRAGMSPAAVYVHYPTKAEMLAQICSRGHAEVLEEIERALSSPARPASASGASSPPSRASTPAGTRSAA